MPALIHASEESSQQIAVEFFNGAAINGTISTDTGTLSPVLVSIRTCPTDIGWGGEYSAPKGVMAIFSVLTRVNLSWAAVFSVIKERYEPSSKRMLPCIRIPLPTTGAIAVFSRLTVTREEEELLLLL